MVAWTTSSGFSAFLKVDVLVKRNFYSKISTNQFYWFGTET
jgi:hypothetical protein